MYNEIHNIGPTCILENYYYKLIMNLLFLGTNQTVVFISVSELIDVLSLFV